MKRMMIAGLLAGFASVAPAGAATLFVGHGIDGQDLGLPQALPVDVCLVTDMGLAPLKAGLMFQEIELISDGLDAGRYDVEVRVSGGPACEGPVAAAASIFLGIGENATALAHLTEQGTPTITKFVNDVRPLGADETRLYARHGAAFGDVDVYLRSGNKSARIRNLENPDQEGATLKAGRWGVAIFPSGSPRDRVFAQVLSLDPGFAYFAYAVGSPANETFTVLIQAIQVP